ncbi:MAG TPA: ATP12 family protein [Verrucomicrobiae bacterium]|nr:ATP12 family protein [Verrucomicrobiae bacterium]
MTSAGRRIGGRSSFVEGEGLKRVYKKVAVEAVDGGYCVTLDGKPLLTPARAPLVLPRRALIEAIAAEWDSQTEEIRPATMPVMQFVSTAIDRVKAQRDRIAADTAGYAATDLVCYRAELPAELVARQHRTWQPLVDWVRHEFDAPLTVTAGVMPRPQPVEALQALRSAIDGLDDLELTALQALTGVCGSLVIALALRGGFIDADQAWAASQLDETFQIEKWGEDAEAAKRRQALLTDIRNTARFLEMLRQ